MHCRPTCSRRCACSAESLPGTRRVLAYSGQHQFNQTEGAVATPNYGYEKRQKELAKKRKKEDKLREKADRKAGIPGGDSNDGQMPQDGEGATPAAIPPQA